MTRAHKINNLKKMKVMIKIMINIIANNIHNIISNLNNNSRKVQLISNKLIKMEGSYI
jgi:hypothetical protein